MTNAQRRQVRDLFEQAMDLEPSAAKIWLEQHSVDIAVREEVESLLFHHTHAGEFLAEPVAARMPELLDDDPLREGAVVGGYTIVAELGRGGMGRVYRAKDARLGRDVALKVLPSALTRDPSQRERLRREARAAALLTHPGICTIYALEEHDAELFIVAELIDGRSLREEIASGARPSPEQLQTVAGELASALASAHAKGITHRDLKPENVMRTREGRLKVLDFGLALVDDTATFGETSPPPRMTQPGAFVGTPAYMAPEQLNGGLIDARTDVFAVGVLLYEYATGVHPFEAATPLALAARILEGNPQPIEDYRPDLAPALARFVARCLRKPAAERFASAGEMADALAQPVIAAPARKISTWWRTHQFAVIALYLIAAGLAWQVKEWHHGPAALLFLLVGVAATVGGVFRGHLLFTERMNQASFDAERRRASPITLIMDVLIALALTVDGLMIAPDRSLAAVLTIALAVGIFLARLVVERSTARGAFGR